ncbi:serine hydrolase domain-containing protein [Streptomyces griseosporeus]
MAVRKALAGAAALVASVALAAPALAAGPAHHDATRAALRAAVADGVPGVTATVTEGRTGWSATEGVGDLRRGTPRSTADRYRVGSVSKTFVATVLLQLEAEGRLSLDDTVEKWLPGVVRGHGHDGRRVTVRQLLNHTSGIYDYTRDDGFVRTYFLKEGFLQHRYDTLRPQELVAIAMSHEPIFEPGESWTYSNTNYILAGMIVERVTGHSYGDEIHRRVIAPLGLRGTSVPGTRPTLPQPSSRAYGKLAKTATGPTYDVTELNPSLAGAAGEMISDSADLNRFYRALLGGRLLPPRQLAEMKDTVDTTGHLPGVRYGLGLADRELGCGVHVWGHNGGIHGSGTDAVTTEDGRHALAFNFNADWTGDNDAVLEAEFCD